MEYILLAGGLLLVTIGLVLFWRARPTNVYTAYAQLVSSRRAAFTIYARSSFTARLIARRRGTHDVVVIPGLDGAGPVV